LESCEPESSVLKLSDQVRSTHNQDGAVVLDIRHGQMFRLNLVGSRMLELLKQGCSEAWIANEISASFSVDRGFVEADLREFLAHLEKHCLLELRPADSHSAL
jgi:hypothetical protein